MRSMGGAQRQRRGPWAASGRRAPAGRASCCTFYIACGGRAAAAAIGGVAPRKKDEEGRRQGVHDDVQTWLEDVQGADKVLHKRSHRRTGGTDVSAGASAAGRRKGGGADVKSTEEIFRVEASMMWLPGRG